MPHRRLTINFQRSVSASGPTVMEVALTPLSDPSAPDLNLTLVGGTQRQEVLLTNDVNPVHFDLIPSDSPELTERVLYRIAWRQKLLGAMTVKDFVMPDFDVDFDDLDNLGNIIGGEVYLQWTDRGRAGGVAGLDAQKRVIDGNGQVVTGDAAAQLVQDNLDDEIGFRQAGDDEVRADLLAALGNQLTSILATITTKIAEAVTPLQAADATEKSVRQLAVASLNSALQSLQNAFDNAVSDIEETLGEHAATLADKADLDETGKVPLSQIPEIQLGVAHLADDEDEMLGLDAKPGDFAVRPEGVWFLNDAPASDLDNWVQFQIAATVFSVNGEVGAVVITASDLGARLADEDIPIEDVSGLTAALNAKASASALTTLTGRVSAIEEDETLIRTDDDDLLPRELVPEDVAFVDLDTGLITRKDGTVIGTGTNIDDVTGLVAALAAKASVADLSDLADVVDTKVSSSDLGDLADIVAAKADLSDLDDLADVVDTKASASDLSDLADVVDTKADTSAITDLEEALALKADLDDGVVPLEQLPDFPAERIDGLDDLLADKADLDGDGLVPAEQLPPREITDINGLEDVLAEKADLVDGVIPSSQIPAIATTEITIVESLEEMLELTGADVQSGDWVVVSSDDEDQGTYVLRGADPGDIDDWVLLLLPYASVVSVNGERGVVTITPETLGARPADEDVPLEDVDGLTDALAAKASTSDLTSGLATKPSLSDVQDLLSASSPNKLAAKHVATSNLASLSGMQSINGTITTAEDVVLLTAQTSSVNNGLYVAKNGSWVRATDMATSSAIIKGALVVVGTGTTGESLWQQTSATGVVGTDANNWVKVASTGTAPSYSVDADSGLARTGSAGAGYKFAVKAKTGGGLAIDSDGVYVDLSASKPVTRKYAADIAASGSATVTITHNLNTTDVVAAFRDKSTGDAVLVGWKPVSANAISAEFAAAPTTGQWRVVVIG